MQEENKMHSKFRISQKYSPKIIPIQFQKFWRLEIYFSFGKIVLLLLKIPEEQNESECLKTIISVWANRFKILQYLAQKKYKEFVNSKFHNKKFQQFQIISIIEVISKRFNELLWSHSNCRGIVLVLVFVEVFLRDLKCIQSF